MKILVSGSGGLVGSAVVSSLASAGQKVTRLIRSRPSRDNEVQWNPAAGILEASALEGMEGVVHLAGENIASGRWNAHRKTKIRDSRVKGTRLLCEALAKLEVPPRVLVCASAIGFYGNRGDEVLTEESPAGSGFLADVCREWEAAAQAAVDKGIRVVHLRLGMVLSTKGGALAKMLFPFRMGVGGRLGNGQQYISWIAIDDVTGVIEHALSSDDIRGPLNAVAPQPVTNSEFTRTLGRVLSRPTIFPMPSFAARTLFGEMAEELLLASTRVEPKRLLASGYAFRFPELLGALSHVLGRPTA